MVTPPFSPLGGRRGMRLATSPFEATPLDQSYTTLDGNEATARIAYAASEVIAIYPITPASPMGELSDAWAAKNQRNAFGVVPEIIEMQSEGGAAGAVHGALQAGALTTTFTASQGLLLMLPNLFKIAGELTPAVIHVAARSIATHALSIFGDHSDVMAARSTGFAQLASGSVQEAHDLALIAHAATLRSRIPFLHFFDGFRTSHEINKIALIAPEHIQRMLDEDAIRAHRDRALNPNRPVLRGTAQNPDVFFQAREAVNSFYDACPRIVQETMDEFQALTGRAYRLFDYEGAPDAERVVVLMGSGAGAASIAVRRRFEAGEKVGLLRVRLYRPFDAMAFCGAIPSTARSVAVLDRTKEPGAPGEPLYLDVAAALDRAAHHGSGPRPTVIGGRYGLSSKEFTPSMVDAVFDELRTDAPKHSFTVGIVDDVTNTHLRYDDAPEPEASDVYRAVFYGLGSDGTVGANKNAVKIIGENTDLWAQGYFVYDSKKSGATTVSHLRFSPRPIEDTYLIQRAQFIGIHQFGFLERVDCLSIAEDGATVLLNSPYPADETWAQIPIEAQRALIDKNVKLYVINAYEIAREAGLKNRINTVMQVCFFALAELLPTERALEAIRVSIVKTYGKGGKSVVERNLAAVDRAVQGMVQVTVPANARGTKGRRRPVPEHAPDFVQRVTAMILDGQGDRLPVSAMPVDGTFPTGTAQFEKRSIALDIPIWDPDVCTQCGLCPLVCPHAAIRMKAYAPAALHDAPDGFQSRPAKLKDLDEGSLMTIQVAPDDCTGCGVCVDVCPAKNKSAVKHKAINMRPKLEHGDAEREHYRFFLDLPETDRKRVNLASVKGSQLMLPLFEYSGACGGCGETPYLKLLTQIVGDRLMVANATGCSSIYGGNLPTTPWSKNAAGRGPSWSNSLFEDNAEFGLGMRLAADRQAASARQLLEALRPQLPSTPVDALLSAEQNSEADIEAQRARVDALVGALAGIDSTEARRLEAVADHLIRRSVWIIGGDGWAYDIGFGGLDHVLASGRNVNILVLDTEVYSNTGGQSSKATSRGAIAKFAAAGKSGPKKDLGMIAMAYGNVYVAQIAMGGSPAQTINALAEAESYEGVSLVLAYSTCIAHGIDMTKSMSHQKEAVKAGYWPLYRFDPRLSRDDKPIFHLDSRRPSLPFTRFAETEGRYAMLSRSDPARAAHLFSLAQKDIDERWHLYEQLAGVERHPTDQQES